MGLVIPGFVPSPLGEIVEYWPTWVELAVTAGIWAMGLFVLTVLVRVALPIALGHARSPLAAQEKTPGPTETSDSLVPSERLTCDRAIWRRHSHEQELAALLATGDEQDGRIIRHSRGSCHES